jgi:hypothetical protein
METPMTDNEHAKRDLLERVCSAPGWTPAQVLSILRFAASMHVETAVLRTLDKSTRASDHTTLYGSTGCVRRRTCVYCRSVIATSSAKYRETQRSHDACAEHAAECAPRYLAARLAYIAPSR